MSVTTLRATIRKNLLPITYNISVPIVCTHPSSSLPSRCVRYHLSREKPRSLAPCSISLGEGYHQLTEQYHRLCTAVLYVATSFFASKFENILVGTASKTAGLVIGQTRIAFGRLWLLEREFAGVGCCTTKDEMVGGQGSEVVRIIGRVSKGSTIH